MSFFIAMFFLKLKHQRVIGIAFAGLVSITRVSIVGWGGERGAPCDRN